MNRNSGVEAVVTSFNQKNMIYEAVHSLCRQTVKPERIIVADDGSSDEMSVRILNEIEADRSISVPIQVIRQKNSGVSAARNAGILKTQTPLVLVLDGDDSLEPSYIEEVSHMLRKNPCLAAASSWMHTFGVLEADVHPSGGGIADFLSRNCCPASHIFRRSAWLKCGGYDESMKNGFEDWEFFLNMLEANPGMLIGIVEKPLINYRTALASSNIKSMEKRTGLMRYMIEKHINSYKEHVADAVLGIESISMERLYGWECEMIHAKKAGRSISSHSKKFMESPSYGDGGMAAAVRLASAEYKKP